MLGVVNIGPVQNPSLGATYHGGNKDGERSSFAKDALGFDVVHGTVELDSESIWMVTLTNTDQAHRLALEGFPKNRPIQDGELRFSGAWTNAARRDVVNVHDADNVIFSIAAALEVGVELVL